MSTGAKELLEKVEEAIAVRFSGGAVANYNIAGRSLAYIPLSELQAMRKDLYHSA